MKKAIAHLSATDNKLKEIIDAVQLLPTNLRSEKDIFQSLIRAIIYQQLSGKAAGTIYKRFLALFSPNQVTAITLLALSADDLRAAGISRQKATYLHALAQFWNTHQLHQAALQSMTDEALITLLTQIKGVGIWTVQMLLMFTLDRPDVLPTGDLAIRQAMTQLYKLEGTGKALEKQMELTAAAWQPYRTIACRYLWRWHDLQK